VACSWEGTTIPQSRDKPPLDPTAWLVNGVDDFISGCRVDGRAKCKTVLNISPWSFGRDPRTDNFVYGYILRETAMGQIVRDIPNLTNC